jgi:hypothetical protein
MSEADYRPPTGAGSSALGKSSEVLFLNSVGSHQNCNGAIHDESAADLALRHEYFVDATLAAKFLSISRKYLLKLSRVGHVPAHPVGIGSRKQWRYRISELEKWALSQNTIMSDNANGSLRAAKKGGK